MEDTNVYALAVALTLALASPTSDPPPTVEVSADPPRVTFSAGGHVLAASQGKPLFTVLYSDTPDIWEARSWIDLPPDAVMVTRSGSRLIVEARSFGGKPIRCRAVATPTSGEVRWDVTVRNDSGGTVVGVVGPGIRGVADIPAGRLYIPDRPGQRLSDPWRVLAAERRSIAYPVPASMQYITYAGPDRGLALHVLDRSMTFKYLAFGGPERELTVYQYPFIPPGATRKLPTIVWQALSRDWHEAAERYRRWFRSWAVRPSISPQVRRYPIMGGTVVRARPVEDEHLKDVTKSMEVGTYAAALEQARDLKAGGYDGTELVGWFGQGHDTTYPDHWPSDAMGGVEGLKRTLSAMREMGMISVLYLNARLAAIDSPTLAQHPDWEVMQEGGRRWIEQYGGGRFVVLCPAARGWQAHLHEEVRRAIEDYGADAVQLDQIGAASSMLCFNRDHGHSTPATAWAEGYLRLLRDLQRDMRRIRPHYWQWVEGTWEGSGQFIDGTQGGFWPSIPGVETFPQLYRYTHPEHPLFGDARMGGIPYWCPSDITRNRRINAAIGELFWNAEFLDDMGLTASDGAEVHWFLKGKQAVVTVFNASGAAEAISVTTAANRLPSRSSPRIARATASDEPVEARMDPAGLSLRVRVPPGQVEAILLKW
jgi:hypothetical protein